MRNIPLKVDTPVELWNKIMKEVKVARYAGPFTKEEFPFRSYIQSPVGLVPKAGNKTRLIFHLSFDFGEQDGELSVNHFTPPDLCTVKYNDLDVAVKACINLVQRSGVSQLYFGKMDATSAFSLLPISLKSRPWLVMKVRHPISKELFYFIDKCLPFGSSISCALFQKFSDSLRYLAEWRIEIRLKIPLTITNYLDDLLFAAISTMLCNSMLQIFLDLCTEINCPMSPEKTEWATQLIIFLGILLNGCMLVMSMPQEKRLRALTLLQQAMSTSKHQVRFIQKIMGMLNFLHKAIVPGRAFTHGMYQKLKLTNSKGQSLKQYHHVSVGTDFKQDCRVWVKFLCSTSQKICRPFVDFDGKQGEVLNLASDTAKSDKLEMGATFNDRWLFMAWGTTFIRQMDPSIEFLELYALTMAIVTWEKDDPQLTNNRVVFFCDNQAVLHMVNNFASSCPQCRKLLLILALWGIRYNLRVTVRYVRSEQNVLPDVLSRPDFAHFYRCAPSMMNPKPDRLDQRLLPIMDFWQDDVTYLNQF